MRELTPAGPAAAPGGISGRGFSGVLVAAPPVYDPGGPVFDADRIVPGTRLDVIERAAAAAGAVLAVAPAAPGTALAGDLQRSGWTVASDWYLGWPVAQDLRARPHHNGMVLPIEGSPMSRNWRMPARTR